MALFFLSLAITLTRIGEFATVEKEKENKEDSGDILVGSPWLPSIRPCLVML